MNTPKLHLGGSDQSGVWALNPEFLKNKTDKEFQLEGRRFMMSVFK